MEISASCTLGLHPGKAGSSLASGSTIFRMILAKAVPKAVPIGKRRVEQIAKSGVTRVPANFFEIMHFVWTGPFQILLLRTVRPPNSAYLIDLQVRNLMASYVCWWNSSCEEGLRDSTMWSRLTTLG